MAKNNEIGKNIIIIHNEVDENEPMTKGYLSWLNQNSRNCKWERD